MGKFIGTAIFDNGLDYIRARIAAGDTVKLHVIKAYSAGDSYATVVGNSCGAVTLSAGDLTLGNQGTNGRQVAVASKSITLSANSGATPDLHQVVVNETATAVYGVADETSDQVLTSGNTYTSFAFALKFSQPA